MMLTFSVEGTTERLVLSDTVIEHFLANRQKRWYQKEAGGQLFATVSGGTISVIEATGPRRTDKRSRFSYVADREVERQEIREKYAKGLHYVGDWHTHPERIPKPSALDIHSIQECVNKSRHTLNAFVLIIVGHGELPNGLHVLINNGRDTKRLSPT